MEDYLTHGRQANGVAWTDFVSEVTRYSPSDLVLLTVSHYRIVYTADASSEVDIPVTADLLISAALQHSEMAGRRVLPTLADVERLYLRAEQLTNEYRMCHIAHDPTSQDPMRSLANSFKRNHEIERYPTFPIFERYRLQALYDPIEECIRAALGYTPREALLIIDAIFSKTKPSFAHLHYDGNLDVRPAQRLPCLSDISHASSVNETACRSYLEHAAATLSDFTNLSLDDYFTINHPLRIKSILKTPDDRYLLLDRSSAIFQVHEQTESGLSKTPDLLAQVHKRRDQYAEQRTTELLGKLTRRGTVLSGYKYTGLDGKRTEGDSLLLFDSVAVFAEVKAGKIHDQTKRGRRNRTETNLTDLIKRGNYQAQRAISAAKFANDAWRVSPARGKARTLDLSLITHWVPLVVTFEDLNGCTSNYPALEEGGYIQSDEITPLILSLHDLELIVEVGGTLADLVHFQQLRHELREVDLLDTKEIDLFIYCFRFGTDWARGGCPIITSYPPLLHLLAPRYTLIDHGLPPEAKRPDRFLTHSSSIRIKLLIASEPTGYINECLALFQSGFHGVYPPGVVHRRMVGQAQPGDSFYQARVLPWDPSHRET